VVDGFENNQPPGSFKTLIGASKLNRWSRNQHPGRVIIARTSHGLDAFLGCKLYVRRTFDDMTCDIKERVNI
jgi:hypothetical protein